MANALTDSGGDTCPLIDPRPVRASRDRLFREDVPELARANSFTSPGGRWPASGWVLVRRGDFNKINPYATNLQLTLADDVNKTSVTLQNLTVVQARCVTRGFTADPNAIYLVQLTDPQGVLYNPWFQFPTTSQYNVRAPAYDGQYYSASTNGGTPWTWDGMVGDLWGQMSPLGPYPHLPAVLSDTPENWCFPGQSAWEALNEILEGLGQSVSADLTKTNPYGIVISGTADAAFTALQAQYAGRLQDDYEWLDTGSGRVPKQVIVYFHRRNQFYGTEETVRSDSLQWQSTPLYQVTVAAPPTFVNAVGTAFLWADFSVRFDVDNHPLPADVATANTVAAQMTTDYFNKLYRGTQGFMRQVYSGVLPFYVGSLCDGVTWRQTGLDSRDPRMAWQTVIFRGYYPEDVTFPTTLMGISGPY